MTDEKKQDNKKQPEASGKAKEDTQKPEEAKKQEKPQQKEQEQAQEAKPEEKEAKAEVEGKPPAPEKGQKDEGKEEASQEEKKEDKEPFEHTISGLMGRKIGMTQIFDPDGNVIPVTVVETGPCKVLELKDEPVKVKVGFETVKEGRVNNARAGYFKKIKVQPMRIVKEFPASDNKSYKIGQDLNADVFKPGDYVDVTGTSIGKGFQGGMKRWGWSGGPGGHGSMHHRRVGAIGACADPSRVFKGRTMPGRMGNRTATTQGLRVMGVDVEKNLILIKGSVPGHKNTAITILKSRKKAWKSLEEKKAVVIHKVNPMKQSKAKAGAAKKGKKK